MSRRILIPIVLAALVTVVLLFILTSTRQADEKQGQARTRTVEGGAKAARGDQSGNRANIAPDPPVEPKLVAWWKLDERNGQAAADSAGDHIGTLIGDPVWKPSGGKISGALELDGVDDYARTDYAVDLPAWTAAVWVKSPAAPAAGMPSGPVHRHKNYQINWDHGRDAFRGAAGACVDGQWHAASFGELRADAWHHLVATYDGENLSAYRDGALIETNSDPSSTTDAESETLKFGRHAIESNYFCGTIDDIRIYNYALSSDEIAALFRGE